MVAVVEQAPLWGVAVLPLVLGGLVLFASVLDAAFAAAAAGRAVGAEELIAPLRGAAGLLLRQPRVVPRADVVLRRIGVGGLVAAALLAAAVVPLGGVVVADLSVGVAWFNAMGVLPWVLVWMAGWGSNSAFALFGGYRFTAQALAYELPLMFALTAPPVAARSLRVGEVVEAQRDLWFVVWMPVAFAVYLVGVLGMAFWGPMGQPVGGDVAGGAGAELSGVDALVFSAGRRLLLVVGAAFAVPLFLGGGSGPLLPGWAWSLLKTLAVIGLLVWLRWRLPVARPQWLVGVGWLVLLPLSLAQVLVVCLVVVLGGS